MTRQSNAGGEATSVAGVVATYASSRYYSQLLGLVTAFLRPKLLTPEQYGIWTLLKLFSQYSGYGDLGARSSARYLIPLYAAREDAVRVDAIERTTFSTAMATNLLLSAGLVVAALLGAGGPSMRVGFAAMSVVVILQCLYEHMAVILKAREAFGLLSRCNYVMLTVQFVLTVSLLYLFRLNGLYLSIALTYLVAVVYLRGLSHVRFAPGGSRAVFRELIGKGFPIMVSNLAVVLITTSDRLIVSIMLGREELGYYGIAAMAAGFLMQIPGSAREVLEPRLMKSVETIPEEVAVDEYLLRPMIQAAYLMPFLIGPVVFWLPPVISFALRRYVPGVEATQLLVIGLYFLALAYVPRILIVARNWQLSAALQLPFVLAANVLISIGFVKKGFGLAGVAAGSAFSFLLLSLVLLHFLGARLVRRGPLWVRHVRGTLLGFPLMAVVLLPVWVGVPHIVANAWAAAVIQTVLYTLVFTAVYALAARHLELLRGVDELRVEVAALWYRVAARRRRNSAGGRRER